jgi:small nuclear ribonucleoprotein (snRNP)-like protein
MSGVRFLSESHDSMWRTCWYYHVSCTTSVGKSRQHVTNMLMLSCVVCDFCWKVMTACDQHVNVIMCGARLLSESHGGMWPTCWYYHVLCKTSVGKSRQLVTNRLMLSCLSCTTSVGKSRQHMTNMLMLSCLVYDLCRKVSTACDQHVNVIMSRVRLLSESHDSMWQTC